jgi:hypothetical protein
MIRVKKSLGKIDSQGFVWLVVLMVIAGSSCRKAPSVSDAAIDLGDQKLAAEKIAEAEPLYNGREDLSKLRQALALLREARTADYGSYEAYWKLARADYYLGEHTPDDRERDDLFREGVEAGKAAKQLQPNKPDGHFWLGANYGGSAEHSTLASLSSVDDIKQEMETVLKLDEGYELGSAYLGLGQLYSQAPRVLGGDNAKAIGYLEKGLRFGPGNALLRLRLAEAYDTVNRDGDAKKQIETILSLSPTPGYEAEHKDAVAKAKKLQEKMASK